MNIFAPILNIFPIVLLSVIPFLLLFCLITNLVYIFKHKSDLRYLFKIKKEHKVRDISQIIVHSSIIFLFVFLNLSAYIDMKTPKERPMQNWYAMRKVASVLNAATVLDYKIENKTNIDSIEDFMNSIIKRTSNITLYSYFYDGIETRDFSRGEIEKNNLYEIESKPTGFYQNYDDSMFAIIKFKNGCIFYDDENVLNSDCIILVDGNGLKPPNEHSKDRAYLYIKGDEIPAKIIPEIFLRG